MEALEGLGVEPSGLREVYWRRRKRRRRRSLQREELELPVELDGLVECELEGMTVSGR